MAGLLQGTPAQILFDAPDEFLRCELEAGLGMSAARHGTDRASVDDPWQLPGEFVIGTDGIIRLAHRYGWCEDYPDPPYPPFAPAGMERFFEGIAGLPPGAPDAGLRRPPAVMADERGPTSRRNS